ncbi:MAG: PorV/PorQ family protein [Elusimicrobia bacterium]|nr:PorV/PorQ family protein [Elusimicrobiota bacterium]
MIRVLFRGTGILPACFTGWKPVPQIQWIPAFAGMTAKVLFLSAALFPSAWALDSRTGGTTLLETMDARGAALGEAGSTLGGDLSGVAFNPAVLTTMENPQLETQFQVAPGDVRTGLVSFGRSGPRVGWGASLIALDAGTIEITPLSGAPYTNRAQQDLVGTFSAGVLLGSWFRVGGTVKGLQSKLAGEYSATTVAGDAGILLDLPIQGVRLGGAVQNVGPDLTYQSSGDPLPRVYRGGLSYLFFTGEEDVDPNSAGLWYSADRLSGSKIWVGADAVADQWGNVTGNLGMEWEYAKLATLRLGGIVGDKSVGFTAGIGFLIRQWRLDYSVQLVDELTDRHRLAVSYFWSTDK